MGLLAPSPGEVVDRQTILELKIAAAKKKNVAVHAFNEEFDQLQGYLERNSLTSASAEYGSLYNQLKGVNTQLWNIEDEIRLIIREAGDPSGLSADQKVQVCKISFDIPRLNDQRSELVQQINKLFNMHRQEKFYS